MKIATRLLMNVTGGGQGKVPVTHMEEQIGAILGDVTLACSLLGLTQIIDYYYTI